MGALVVVVVDDIVGFVVVNFVVVVFVVVVLVEVGGDVAAFVVELVAGALDVVAPGSGRV
jgi:hypothetical protein